jgi:hypothetical protein
LVTTPMGADIDPVCADVVARMSGTLFSLDVTSAIGYARDGVPIHGVGPMVRRHVEVDRM